MITAACSQLSDSAVNDWIDVLKHNKKMKAVLGYHGSSPSANDANDGLSDHYIINDFLERANKQSIYAAWIHANTYYSEMTRANGALLVKKGYQNQKLSVILSNDDEADGNTIFLYKMYPFKQSITVEKIIYQSARAAAVRMGISTSNFEVFEVSREVYSEYGNYLHEENVEYVFKFGQNSPLISVNCETQETHIIT